MSRSRVLVEINGEVVVDREIDAETASVVTKNDVQDTGMGSVYRDFRPTGFHSVLVTWTDREQELAFWAPKPTKGSLL